jgi:O-succinylbenzoate synthase
MRIEQISLYYLRMTLKTPFETSFGSIDTRDCLLIEINVDGVTGFGECVADRDPGYGYETAGTAWHILEDFIIPALRGVNIKHPNDFHNLVESVRGHQMAKAGLEMALWDVYAKQEGKSFKGLIKGERECVPVGVSIGIKSSPEILLDEVSKYLEKGYRRIKIKIKPERDVTETALIRKTFPELALQVDANSAYTLETAQGLKPLDDLDLLLIEQPLAEDDLWDHSRLQAQFNTPICLDESIHSLRHTRQAIEMKAGRVINIKAGRVGGLAPAVAIHDFCADHQIPVWCGGMLETGVGRAANLALASLPNFTLPGDISASERYYHEDITNELFTLNEDSTITVPDIPGLGVSINPEALTRATLRKETFVLNEN